MSMNFKYFSSFGAAFLVKKKCCINAFLEMMNYSSLIFMEAVETKRFERKGKL